MTRWLITGATGLLGSNAGIVLGKNPGLHLTAMAHKATVSTVFDNRVTADLTDEDSLRHAVMSAQPDVILHAAALASHETCEADPALARSINVEGTRALVKAAEEQGAKFIHISTDAVFDGITGNYTEESPANPFSVYGKTKLEAEGYVLNYTNALVLRTNFFGWSPTGERSILEFFVNNLSQRTPVRGFTDFTVSSMYVRHLVQTIFTVANTDYRGLLHIAAHNALTKYQFGVTVARSFNLDEDLILPTTSSAVGLSTSRSRDLSLDVARAETLLGSLLPTQAEGITAAHQDWMKTHE